MASSPFLLVLGCPEDLLSLNCTTLRMFKRTLGRCLRWTCVRYNIPYLPRKEPGKVTHEVNMPSETTTTGFMGVKVPEPHSSISDQTYQDVVNFLTDNHRRDDLQRFISGDATPLEIFEWWCTWNGNGNHLSYIQQVTRLVKASNHPFAASLHDALWQVFDNGR